jgi:hypothetical protein
MTAAAAIDAVCGVEIFNHARMFACLPLIVSQGMATPANGTRQLDPGADCWIIGVSGMIAGGAMAILALDTLQVDL